MLTFIVPNLEGMDVPNVITSNGSKKMITIEIIAQQKTTTNEDGTSNGFKVTKNLWGSITKNVKCFYHIHPILLIKHYQTPKVNLIIYSLRMWLVSNLLQLMHNTRSPWHLPKL